MNKTKKQKVVIFFHKNCDDGFGAAWAAWKKFGAKAEYVAYYHKDNIPNVVKGADVYFLDLALPEASMHALKRTAKSITVVDHHSTGAEPSRLADMRVFDLAHSGAVLSWKYFHPKKPIPKLLRHIEDGDLWHWKMRDSMAILQYLSMVPVEFRAWDKFMRELEDSIKRKSFIEKGKLLLAYKAQKVKSLTEISCSGKIAGKIAMIVNSPQWQSELGAALYAEKAPVAIIWWRRPGKIVVSLRSDGTVDVAKIAEKYGGGGHPAAAAFTLPPDDFATILSFYEK